MCYECHYNIECICHGAVQCDLFPLSILSRNVHIWDLNHIQHLRTLFKVTFMSAASMLYALESVIIGVCGAACHAFDPLESHTSMLIQSARCGLHRESMIAHVRHLAIMQPSIRRQEATFSCEHTAIGKDLGTFILACLPILKWSFSSTHHAVSRHLGGTLSPQIPADLCDESKRWPAGWVAHLMRLVSCSSLS